MRFISPSQLPRYPRHRAVLLDLAAHPHGDLDQHGGSGPGSRSILEQRSKYPVAAKRASRTTPVYSVRVCFS
ncbi:hypothetical protein PT974_03278 [Cladobotryum mycophilum]|uniref:Uncharacterized protein n=1 Tax=Cladobotryum mycophilum TaxID=491253 RepID=A0ABR0SSY5_9HYPO